MLLQLSTFPQVPRPHSVVQASCPQLSSISRYVDTRGTVSVALELPHQSLVMKVPDGDVAIRAATKAHLFKFRNIIT